MAGWPRRTLPSLILAGSANSSVLAKPVCTVIADAATAKIVSQIGACDKRLTPASAFKIALSVMGYDSGYLFDEHSPALPFRDGDADWVDSWKATTDPTSWIGSSVVCYSQRLTERLQDFL